jgi:hypothetical protein
MLFALARSIYRDSFQVRNYINNSLTSINDRETELVLKQEELEYAKTPQYQEKIAKELLGLKKRGEEVIIISNEKQNFVDLLPAVKAAEHELLTNPQKWYRYIFGAK